MPNVSVIIPVYNSEKTLPTTIQSILTQKTSKSFELIIVDDESTDKTREVAEQFGNKIKLLTQKKFGPAKARNLGAKNAKSKILLFIDADCVASRKWLEEMIKPFKNKEIAGVQGAYKSKQPELSAKFSQIEIEDRYDLLKEAESLDWIGSYSAGYRKKDFIEAMGFDESFPIASGEDPALSFKMNLMQKKIVFNPEAIVYHMHPKKFSEYFIKKFFRAFYRVILYKKFPKKAVKDSYTPQIMKIRIALIGMLALTLIAGTQFNLFNFLSFLLIMLIIISTIPFSVKAFEKDKEIGLMSPVILITRDAVFLIGLIFGIINSLVKTK
jgi:glycosyltransferase involved in cell wall biosynthesis